MGEKKNKISVENAELQFGSMLDYFDMSFSDIEIEDGEKAALTMKNFLVRSIQKGRLEVSIDAGELKVIHRLDFPTEKTTEIVYSDKFATAKIAMRKASDEDKEPTFMSALSGVPAVEFSKLKAADVTTFSRLATVFSMV